MLEALGSLKNIHFCIFLAVQMNQSRRQSITSLGFSLKEDKTPYYQQLVAQILNAIERQKLLPGDRLPGSRDLALSLGVSRSTVVHAYERLISEGILVSKNKSGVFVAEVPARAISLTPKTLPQAKPKPLSFDSGSDTSAFPRKAWQKCMKQSWTTPDSHVLEDNYPTGYPQLKQAIADYLYQLRGFSCTSEQVVITAGSRDSLSLLRHLFGQISQGSHWLTENPTHKPIRNLLSHWNDSAPFLLPVDESGCQLPAQQRTPVVLLTPNRQYPSGVAMSSERKQTWLQALNNKSLWVVEDDYDNEFNYQGRMSVPLMQADRSGRVFYIGSFSKVLFRGLRLGFIVAPVEHCANLYRSREELGGSAALPMQPVLADFMSSGEFGRHINRMRRHYRKKRDGLLSLLNQLLAPWFDWQTPSGGMHLIIRLRPQVKETLYEHLGDIALPIDQHIAQLLTSENIKLEPLSNHYGSRDLQLLNNDLPSPETPSGFILGFTNPEEKQMKYILEKLALLMLSHH